MLYGINILSSQLSPSSINLVPVQAVNAVSGVAMAMRHGHRGTGSTPSTVKDREMSTHAYAPPGRGTIYLTEVFKSGRRLQEIDVNFGDRRLINI